MSEIIHGHAVGNRNFSIDFLRFFAATIVVLYHYTIASPELHYGLDGLAFQYPVLESYLRYGYLGNDLFFIISGLVIFNSTKSATFTGFWYGRFSRLYPTYWICLGLTSILLLLVGTWSERGISFSIFLFNLTMLQKMVGVQDIDQVYWTLAYEMVFYFWVSLVILFGRRDIYYINPLLANADCAFGLFLAIK